VIARRTRRGRTWVAALLVGFVVVASAVVWRRAIGLRQGDTLRDLTTQRLQWDGERARLESDIRLLSDRAHLGAVAEQRLHLRVPDDRDVIVLPAVPPPPRPAGGDGAAH